MIQNLINLIQDQLASLLIHHLKHPQQKQLFFHEFKIFTLIIIFVNKTFLKILLFF